MTPTNVAAEKELYEAKQAVEAALERQDVAILAAYKGGLSLRLIAAHVGVSHEQVRRMLGRIGVSWTS